MGGGWWGGLRGAVLVKTFPSKCRFSIPTVMGTRCLDSLFSHVGIASTPAPPISPLVAILKEVSQINRFYFMSPSKYSGFEMRWTSGQRDSSQSVNERIFTRGIGRLDSTLCNSPCASKTPQHRQQCKSNKDYRSAVCQSLPSRWMEISSADSLPYSRAQKSGLLLLLTRRYSQDGLILLLQISTTLDKSF